MIDLREMTVLVADDVENMFNSIRSIMRLLKFGRTFLYAADGEEALKILKQEQVDLAILDNNMPGIPGVELLGIIRNDNKLRDMPVIMITADANMEYVTKAAETEIDAYLLKPITVGLLKEKIPPVIEKANNPTPMFVHLKKAGMFAEDGNLNSAIEETMLAMEANPESSRPLRELGFYLLQKGDLAEAETYLLSAAKMNPVDVVAFNLLGDLYLKQDKIDNALKYFTKAVGISPRHYERGLNLGKILIKKKMINKANTVFNKVFQLSKEPLKLKEEIADFCIEEGSKEYAVKLLKNILEQDRSRVELLFKLGVIHEEAGENDEALDCFTEAEQKDNKNFEIKIRIAKIYLSQGTVLRAERPLKAILKIDPEHKEAQKLLQECI